MAKRAAKYEANNLYHEAAYYYLDALSRDRNNLEARLGLQKNGQKVLDDHLSTFYKAHTVEDHKVAVYAYLEAEKYNSSVRGLDVKLSFPEYHTVSFKEDKAKYVESLYQQGVGHINSLQYESARAVLEELQRLEPHYKEVDNLYRTARLEPHYLQGKEAYQAGRFRNAYYSFDKILAEDANYKDSGNLREQARLKAQLTVGILPFSNYTSDQQADEKVAAYLLSSIMQVNNPFLKVIDREHTAQLLREQRLGMSGTIDESTAAQAGRLLGLKTVIIGKLISYNQAQGTLQAFDKKGMEEYQVKVVNDSTKETHEEIRLRPINYKEYSGESNVQLVFQYMLISSETGEILQSEMIEMAEKDVVHFAKYQGNYKSLIPEQGQDKKALIQLFENKQALATVAELSHNAFKNTAQKMTAGIMAYEKSRN